jgi:hypothetical protein
MLDILIVGCRVSKDINNARDKILARCKDLFPDAKVYYFCSTEANEAKTGVSERDWLLFNVPTQKYSVVVPYEKCIQHNPYRKLKEVITSNIFTAESEAARIEIECDIEGIDGLYYNQHRIPKIRFTDGNFNGRLPKVAMLVPMTLRGLQNPLKTIPLVVHLAPSLVKTITHCKMDRYLYLGLDVDEKVPDRAIQMIRNSLRSAGVILQQIIRFPPTHRKHHNMSLMYNDLFTYAMMDGCDFAIQLQDDSRLETPTWDRILGSFICSNPLCIGAYSLADRFKPKRMNNIMVSRTHFDIFGFLFNPKCSDTHLWTATVLGQYAKVVDRTKVTNTIRSKRVYNKMNGGEGSRATAVEEADQKLFEEFVGRVQIH